MGEYWVRKLASEDAPVVVFVHGILSDANRCWKPKSGTGWPQLLSEDSALDAWSIYVAQYYSAIGAAGFSISNASQELWLSLKSQGVMDGRPILFVCHSMGGIVVRKMLLSYQGEVFPHTTIGLLLVASPTYGSGWATLLRPFIRLLGHAQAAALAPIKENDWLKDVGVDFRKLISHNYILGRELIENVFHPWLFFLPPIVSEERGYGVFNSAPEKIGGTTHSSITKPKALDSRQHMALVDLVRDLEVAMRRFHAALPESASFGSLEALLTNATGRSVVFGAFRATELAALPTVPVIELRAVTAKGLIRAAWAAYPPGSIRPCLVQERGPILFVEPI